MSLKIWKLHANCDGAVVLRTELGYFQRHFVGKSMASTWKAPRIRIEGKNMRLRDFLCWMLTAPVISEKARTTLDPVVSRYAEMLPLIEIFGQPYYAINVIQVEDCLDIPHCKVVRSPTDGRIMNIHEYAFKRVPEVPIFKVPQGEDGSVFVTLPFIDFVKKEELRGAIFADPAANAFSLFASGKLLNVVPGVPD